MRFFEKLSNLGIVYLELKETEHGSPIRGRFAMKVHRLTGKLVVHGETHENSATFTWNGWYHLEDDEEWSSKMVRVIGEVVRNNQNLAGEVAVLAGIFRRTPTLLSGELRWP